MRASAIFVAAAIVGAAGYWYFASRLAPVPKVPLRIGFEPNPPFQIRTADGFGGLAVEIVDEAARRAGLKLQWVQTGTSSDEAFQKKLVDLWPLMTDLPERRKRVHFSAPWVMSNHVLLLRAGSAAPDRSFTGRIALFKLPLHIRLVHREYPQAQAVPLASGAEVVRQVCEGAATGFLEKRVAIIAMQETPPGCVIRMQVLPDLTFKNCVASTFEAAGAAELLRREIGSLFRDGTLAQTLAKYSASGFDDAWATYDLLEESERGRWIAWGTGAFAVAITLALGQTFYLRQRKRAETVLRQNEERFRAIFQQAGVGVAQLSLDGKVVIANDRYCEVVGYSQQDLVGRGTREISHREDLQTEVQMLPRLLAGEIPSFALEKRYTRQDGTTVWATMCRTVVRDRQGHPEGFIAVVEDVTERKKAEAALRESEERFRNLADSAPVLIWMTGPDKGCTFLNRAWLQFTGRDTEEGLRDGWLACIHTDDRERVIETYTSAFDAHRDFQVEFRLQNANGGYRWVLSHAVARPVNGTFEGYIGCSLDISDLKRGYEQHLATQKLESVGVLAAGVAHDFNNLLGSITALAESAHSELAPASPAAGDVDRIRQTALQAARITSQLMTFASPDNAPATTLDLSAVVAGMLDLLKVSISKSAVLETSLAHGLPPISANSSEIRQLVMNLVTNASEALEGKPGTITIATTAAQSAPAGSSSVRLEVADTGSGITPETKARLFDPFFSTRGVGRGLGLSAIQGIIRRLGGSIEVESERNAGSRFIVVLPALVAPPLMDIPVPDQSTIGAKAHKTVLFIEDEEALRSTIAKLLRKRSFTVLEAQDGPRGIEIFKNSTPDEVAVILLDVTLPGMQGGEVLDELRRIRPDVRVILCTAYSRETAMAEFGGRPIDGFIRKPYRTDDLVKLLDECSGV